MMYIQVADVVSAFPDMLRQAHDFDKLRELVDEFEYGTQRPPMTHVVYPPSKFTSMPWMIPV
jgi:hypothetical protein